MAFFSGLKASIPMILVLYFSLTSFTKPGLADPPYFLCSNVTYNPSTNRQFKENLNTLFTYLSSKANLSMQFSTSIGDGPDRAYGQFMCVPFLSAPDCGKCITIAYQAFRTHCPDDWEAVVWEDNCQLRYSNRTFLGHLDVSGNKPFANKKNISNPDLFTSVVHRTVGDLTKQAASNSSMRTYAQRKAKFKGSETLYALVQCTSDLSSHQCTTCLSVALENISSWYYFSRGARLLSRSCYLRYELYAFYLGATGESPAQEHNNKIEKWLIVAIVAVAVSAFFGFIVFRLVAKRGDQRTRNKINNEEGQFQNSGDQSYIEFHQRRDGLSTRHSPFFDLASIRSATKNFSEANLLGQGGFGSVYKGVLFDGKEVAIKRLSIDSEQGTEEFSNEVLLIMKLQHKNLVRLLGFCVHGEEKLLVYEFMPNSSLDRMLFDPKYQKQLDWNKRVNIINGIARGLLYLHQDSRLRIIHRDLKASNVLLNSDMEPKISDFGTARIYAGNEGEITARPVGTCGYMAPEYAMEGLYSVKSDVYSFGVLMLVIITGRMGSGLVANAWRLWNEDNALELLDPSLTDPQHSDEFLRFMHIGLLCVQQDAGDRPTMSSVVSMLTSESEDLPQPEKPAFAAERSADHKEDCNTEMSANGVTVSSISPR